ncbi:MAG: 2-succinyl-5-enolpyruvyl-6-hydroxy-3-cyclohexene-1-carboxylic-acid synthase [Actinobacteria bacterium]|nr:2-succinyl-5-enolpyruvyl-6-hydroxy-3-cyclohexene-1-carboxylic-acid synthase [Actinomycetota bacterium]
MSRPNPSTAMAEVVIDELHRNGVALAVISPGSRSGALAIAADSQPGVETVVALDERSAAFHALGRGKTGQGPAVVISTSGTAPANWYPAVVEADMSMTPLVLLSADRPPELRGVGANQTIDQVEMFGGKVRHFADLGVDADNARWREEVCRAVSAATGPNPGPVHLNLWFREPLVPIGDDGRTRAEPYIDTVDGRPDGATWLSPESEPPPHGPSLDYMGRGVVVAGDGVYDRDRLISAARGLGWPLLGTVLSGLRGRGVIDTYHHLLAAGVPDELRPEVVVAIGSVGPSTRLDTLVASASVRVRVDAWGRHIDPGRDATHQVHADPVELLERIEPRAAEPVWSETWDKRATMMRDALADHLEHDDAMSGALTAHLLSRVGWGGLVAGSSLPIREVDAHLQRGGLVVANRGASGIDGIVSLALGVAGVTPKTVALVGDLALLHDGNGFLIDRKRDLTVVVINNGGGGLFDSLPQADHAPDYERLFVTRQDRNLAEFAAFHHLHHQRVAAPGSLVETVDGCLDAGGLHLVEVGVERAHDLATRRALDEIARSVHA